MTAKRLFITLTLAASPAVAQQVADTAFDMSVARPAHTARHPRLVIDEAHNNFHTVDGRYAPFAKLMRNDGLEVTGLAQKLSAASLKDVDVLVISNPAAPGIGAGADDSDPAFTRAECDAVKAWVEAGGSLLLIADHTPFGAAADILARTFGVKFGKGFAYDPEHFLAGRGPTMLVFKDDLLGTHAITAGRDSTERVRIVVSFTGQSMTAPKDATVLLKLSPTAGESTTRTTLAQRKGISVAGRAQGLAMSVGKGRVVMLGEAAMMSAQLAGGAQQAFAAPFKMGMNHDGTDDKQFALNVVRWLTRALP